MPTFYVSTVPFITRAADVPANQPFDGTLKGTLRIDRSIDSQNGYGGFSESISEIELINSDGAYDAGSQVSVNGQTIRLSLGGVTGRDTVDPYASFELIANMTAERVRVDRQAVTIELRDPSLSLSQETVQQGLYAGTGDLEGGDELAGKRRPFLDGTVLNATPTLVIPGELIYQLNDGPIQSLVVRDGGVPLTFAVDYGTVAELRAALAIVSPKLIGAGFYATCLQSGYFGLGGSPVKQITCDATGPRNTTADIIENVARSSVGFVDADFDLASFDQLNIDQPAIVGYFLDADSSQTCADMFTNLMRGIGGWHGMTALGKLRVARFDAPGVISVAAYNTSGEHISQIDGAALPQGVDPPPHRRRVIYSRNWTQMSEVLGALFDSDPATANFLLSEHKLAITSEAESAAVLANYPDAPDPDPVEAYFANEADASAEAERLYTLYTAGYLAYRVTLKRALFLHDIGDVINVTDDRLGLENGKNLRIVSITEDLSTESTEVIGFG